MIAFIGHWLTVTGVVLLVAVAARVAYAIIRFALLPTAAKKNYPAALWARFRWRWLTRNLQLAYLDQHRRATKRPSVPFGTSMKVKSPAAGAPMRLRFPRARFRADPFGIVARVRTVPGVGRAEFDAAADYISDAWRCHRVQVSQAKPGRLVIRGLRTDPLTMPFSAVRQRTHAGIRGERGTGTADRLRMPSPARLPIAHGRLRTWPGIRLWLAGSASSPSLIGVPTPYQGVGTPSRLYIGRDEWGQDRYLPLAGATGVVVGGLPGYGKTSLVNSWLMQLAGSAAAQFAVIDGKGAVELDDWWGRCWLHCGDDQAAALAVLEDVHALMRRRFGTVLEQTGHRNAWHRGPTAEFPLVVTVIDECHTFLDFDAVKGDRVAEQQVRRFRALTGQLVRKGRSVLMLTVLVTQKPTADSLPTSIRDNCGLCLAFALKTIDASVACLGDDIRQHRTACPTGLQDPAYIGVATASLRTGLDPYVRVRVPEVSDQAAAERARATASLRADPAKLVTVANLPEVPADQPPALTLTDSQSSPITS